MGIKIQDLVHAGAIEQNGAVGALAMLGGVGALAATVANVVFGKVSDRTTSRWGRRRIWIVLGTVVMTVGLFIMAIAPNLGIAVIGWSTAQLGANMALAPFIATLSDHVPSYQRGKIGSWLMIAQQFGVMGSGYVASAFADQLVIMFVAPSLIAIVIMVIFAVVLPDQVLPVRPERQSFREVIETFWVSPRENPDYALVWWSRFLITFASMGFTGFRYFYLLNHVGVEEKSIPDVIANGITIYTIPLVLAAFLCGWLSDKVGKRKVFVWSATTIYAIGTVALIFVDSVEMFFVIEFILGLAYGVYIGVDMALLLDVLPNPDDAGKDLGVFNIANALPQTFAPMIGGIFVYIGDETGNNFGLWFSICGVICLIGALVIFPIKKVK